MEESAPCWLLCRCCSSPAEYRHRVNRRLRAEVYTSLTRFGFTASEMGSRLKNKVRLAYLVSHPIQYQAPMLRRIAQEPDIDLTVFFGSDFSVRDYKDAGFGVGVKWDVPLLDGYCHEFLPRLRDSSNPGPLSPLNYGIFSRLRGSNGVPGFDVLWVHGYSSANTMQAMVAAKALGIPVLVRAEPWLADRAR